MPVHMHRELDKLKRKILSLSAFVEENLRRAVETLDSRDEAEARRVIEADIQVDELEVDIEEECLKLLALYQPVAIDLRFIISTIKINSDLERIGDLAVKIAERAAHLSRMKRVDTFFDFESMAEKARSMVRRAMDSLVNMDARLARQVCIDDDEVDVMNRRMLEQVKDAMRKRPDLVDPLVQILSTSRHLERVADHATNIAEDVIYMIEGEIVRHRTAEYKRPADAEKDGTPNPAAN
jgi:phosphate transport system protein